MLIPQSQTISRGPAFVTFRGAQFFTKSDITLDFGIKTADLESSAYGSLGKFPTKIAPTLKVPLLGDLSNLGILFPYGAMLVGSSCFLSDGSNALVITPLDTTQNIVTLYQGAVFEEPEMTLGPNGPALGDVTFRFRPVPGQPLTDTAAWFSEGENTWDGTGFDTAELIERIKKHANKLTDDDDYMIPAHCQIIVALAAELYLRPPAHLPQMQSEQQCQALHQS